MILESLVLAGTNILSVYFTKKWEARNQSKYNKADKTLQMLQTLSGKIDFNNNPKLMEIINDAIASLIKSTTEEDNKPETPKVYKYNENYIPEKLVDNILFSDMDRSVSLISRFWANPVNTKESIVKLIMLNLYTIHKVIIHKLAFKFDDYFNECSPRDGSQCCKNGLGLDDNFIESEFLSYMNDADDLLFNFFYNNTYTDDEKKMISIVLTKFQTDFYDIKLKEIKAKIKDIAHSPIYTCRKLKISYILELYMISFREMLDSSLHSLNKMNGALKSLELTNLTLIDSFVFKEEIDKHYDKKHSKIGKVFDNDKIFISNESKSDSIDMMLQEILNSDTDDIDKEEI